MDEAPTIYTIPKYLAIRAARLRWVALAHVVVVPVAIWLPLMLGFRGLRAAVIGALIAVGCLALLQLAPFGAPRTMRRRFRRLTGQTGLIACAAFCLLALALTIGVRLTFVLLGTLALDIPVGVYLLVSLPVYLIPHPEDVTRQQ